MKKQILKTIFSLLTLLSIFSCSNSDSGQNLSQVPLAKSIYDNSNFGIYKGVFVGSSGTIVLDISNTNASITATLIIDGVTHTFTTNQTIQQNQFTTINFIEGNNSFTFFVYENGYNPTITDLIINGHPNAALLVVKETSTVMVKCFEGTYEGCQQGTFNAVIYGNTIKALSRNFNNSFLDATENGTVIDNQINASGTASNGAVFTGELNGNNFLGTWNVPNYSCNGTFSGVRTY